MNMVELCSFGDNLWTMIKWLQCRSQSSRQKFLDGIEFSEIVIEGLNFHVYGNFPSESDTNSEWISVKIPAHFMWPLFVCRCLSDPGQLSPNLSFGISLGYVFFSQRVVKVSLQNERCFMMFLEIIIN